MAHKWFMHDAHLGCALFFLDMLAEYTLLSMTVMVTPCLQYVVGMNLVCPTSKFPQPLLHALLLANPESDLEQHKAERVRSRAGRNIDEVKGTSERGGRTRAHQIRQLQIASVFSPP